jgi:hypothetical protein
MVGAGLQVGRYPLGDRFRAPPGHHRVDQPVASPIGELLGPEPRPLLGPHIVGQGQIEGEELAGDPAGLRRVLLDHHGLLNGQQRPATKDRPRPGGRLRHGVVGQAPAERSAASSSMRGPRAASTRTGSSWSGGPCQGAASMASR